MLRLAYVHLDLEDLILALKHEDPNKQVKYGFGNPHSYRGYYEQLAFEPMQNTTVGEMLAAAESALGKEFEGYKGGTYLMKEYTDCWIAYEGTSQGETLGRMLLFFMLNYEGK
jgi:hypothetical protein